MHGDLRDRSTVDRLMQGVDVLIHLAGTSVERPLPEMIEHNLVGLHEIYEGARRNQVRRIVFASSNHAFGMHSVKDKLSLDAPFRPDGIYGLSKVWGEAMARMYWDKHGIEGVCVRIGSCLPRPTEFRHLSTWFGHEDPVQFMMRCIDVPDVGYVAAWGVSNNKRATGRRRVASASAIGRCRIRKISRQRSCGRRIRSIRSRSSIREADSSRSISRHPSSAHRMPKHSRLRKQSSWKVKCTTTRRRMPINHEERR